ASPETVFGADRFDGELDSPFDRPADWRARYNLCVADARGREDALKQLRLTAPEIYCIQYADAFDSKYPPSDVADKSGASGRGKISSQSKISPLAPLVPQKRKDSY